MSQLDGDNILSRTQVRKLQKHYLQGFRNIFFLFVFSDTHENLKFIRGIFGCDHIFVTPELRLKSCLVVIIFFFACDHIKFGNGLIKHPQSVTVRRRDHLVVEKIVVGSEQDGQNQLKIKKNGKVTNILKLYFTNTTTLPLMLSILNTSYGYYPFEYIFFFFFKYLYATMPNVLFRSCFKGISWYYVINYSHKKGDFSFALFYFTFVYNTIHKKQILYKEIKRYTKVLIGMFCVKKLRVKM